MCDADGLGFTSGKAVADENLLVPRRLALSNINLCTVLPAYADEAANTFLKDAMGWNFVPEALGRRMHGDILNLLEAGAIKPVVGNVVDFANVPQAVQAMADHKTTGKTVITLG